MHPPFHGRNTGFEARTAGTPSPLRWFLRLLYPKHHTRRTTANYRPYRSFRAGCRFGRNGNSWFAVGFRLLRWSSYVPVPTVRSRRARCRYRYTFRPSGFPVRGGCRPKRSRFHPLLHCLPPLGIWRPFCPTHRRCRTKSLSCRLF